MLCKKCQATKLSEEFAPETLTSACGHAPLLCLRCVVEGAKQKQKCPFPGCGSAVTNLQIVKRFEEKLDQLFPEDNEPELLNPVLHDVGGGLNILMMTGESHHFMFSPNQTIRQLKEKLEVQIKVPPTKQKLIYNDKELEEYLPGGVQATLSTYSVPPNSSIHLLIVLYSVPKNFNHVVFDLFWGYPTGGCDFLDASCLVFSGQQHVETIDFRSGGRYKCNGSICHSGDIMDDYKCQGHHTINVKLHSLPPNITHLFFTLSAWRSPTIAHYPNPSLRFYEASNTTLNLCETTFNHARHSQAVIMCYLVRTKSGGWDIVRSGKLSAGNAKRYDSLITTVRGIIQGKF